jgi:hypothetical protein
MVARGVFLAALLGLMGCGTDDESSAGGDAPPPQSCFAPDNLGGNPQNVEDMVALINALPKPVSVGCVLQTLERPLAIEATSNTFSAQPAIGANNPRIFIHRGDLILSIVTLGDPSRLIEFSVLRSPDRSIKGELAFPVEAEIDQAAPYERIKDDDGIGTKCAFCHLAESLDDQLTFADVYESDVLEMPPGRRIELDYMRWLFDNCDRSVQPERCSIFDGIFGYGEVVEQRRL